MQGHLTSHLGSGTSLKTSSIGNLYCKPSPTPSPSPSHIIIKVGEYSDRKKVNGDVNVLTLSEETTGEARGGEDI